MNAPPSPIREVVEEDSTAADLKLYLTELYKRRWVVVGIAALTVALTGVWLSRQPKIYQAAAVLEYDPSPPRPLGSDVESSDDPVEALWLSQEFYETQNRILMSENVAERTVRKLGLNRDLDFLYGPRRPAGARPRSVAAAAWTLRSRLTVDLVRGTRLVNVRVEDTSPTRAARIANAVVASYIEKTVEDRTVSTLGALDWLQGQLGSVRGQLENSEIALHEFKQDNNILSVSLEDRQNMLTNQLEGLTTALTDTRRQRIEANARVAALRAAVEADPSAVHAAAIDSNPEIQALRTRHRDRSAECAALATRYGSEHPEMAACTREVAAIETSMRNAIRGVLTSAESSLREIQEVERGVHGALEEVNRAGLELNLREIEYQRLLRERQTNEHLFGVLLERTAETNVTRFMRVAFARVVDEAMVPGSPSKPRKFVTLVVGGIAGIAFGLLVAILLRFFDRTVASAEDLAAMGLHIVGVVPRIGDTKRSTTRDANAKPLVGLEAIRAPRSPFAECFRMIRTNLAFLGAGKPIRTLLVASAGPGDGKTTVSVNLCAMLAQNQMRVLLIDTDLRRPNVHRTLGIPNGPGVSTILIGEGTLESCVVSVPDGGFDVLTCGPLPPNPSELLDSEAFHALLRAALASYDRVVLDSPPVGVVADAMILAAMSDTTVLIARPGLTPRDLLRQSLRQLRTAGAPVAGCIVNAVQSSDLTYGGAAYYYGRSGYYGQVEPGHDPSPP